MDKYFEYEGQKGFGYPSWQNKEGWTLRLANPLSEEPGGPIDGVLVCFINDKHVCGARNLLTGEESHCKEEHSIPEHVRNAADVILRRVMARRDYWDKLRQVSPTWNSAHDISERDTQEDYDGPHMLFGRPQHWVRDWFDRIQYDK